MGCASGIAKTILFVFNLLAALAGLALLIIGVLYKLDVTKITAIIPEDYDAVSLIPTLLIVVGCIVFVIAFFGCCGAVRENTCMLTTYAVILLILLVLQVALGVVAFLQIKDGEDLKTQLNKSLQKTLMDYDKNNVAREAMDALQQRLQCCGVDSPSDWHNVPSFNNTYPSSCCKDNPQNCTDDKRFSNGCASLLFEDVKDLAKVIGIVVIVIAAVELVGAIFALCLSSSIRNNERRGAYA